jgi:hypothetical protein
MSRLLNWLDSIGRKRVVMDRIDNEPYLERYYVFLKDRKRFPFNVFIHKFLKSDPDDLHDHPWSYATLILKGGYYEWVPLRASNGDIIGQKKVWRGPGHFRMCSANSYHRIELKPGVTAWTLFMPGPQKRDWGFLRKGTWVEHSQYLKERLFQ